MTSDAVPMSAFRASPWPRITEHHAQALSQARHNKAREASLSLYCGTTPANGCSYSRGAGSVNMAMRWHGSKSRGPRPHTTVRATLHTPVAAVAMIR